MPRACPFQPVLSHQARGMDGSAVLRGGEPGLRGPAHRLPEASLQDQPQASQWNEREGPRPTCRARCWESTALWKHPSAHQALQAAHTAGPGAGLTRRDRTGQAADGGDRRGVRGPGLPREGLCPTLSARQPPTRPPRGDSCAAPEVGPSDCPAPQGGAY